MHSLKLGMSQTHKNIHRYKHTQNIQTHEHKHTHPNTHAHKHTHTTTHTKTYTDTSTHKTYKHTNTNAHIETHTHTNTHTHMSSFNLRKIWDIKLTIKEIEVVRRKKAQSHALLSSAPNGDG